MAAIWSPTHSRFLGYNQQIFFSVVQAPQFFIDFRPFQFAVFALIVERIPKRHDVGFGDDDRPCSPIELTPFKNAIFRTFLHEGVREAETWIDLRNDARTWQIAGAEFFDVNLIPQESGAVQGGNVAEIA